MLKSFLICNHVIHSNYDSVITDALTLSSSVVACDGEQVVLACTANQTFVRWTVSTPTMNYTNIETDNNDMEQRLADGVLIFRLASYTPSPLELVATVTVSVSQNFNGTLVECASLISGVVRRKTSVLTLAGKFCGTSN